MAEKPDGLVEAAGKGRLDGLKALRDHLGLCLQGDDGKQAAALARQLRECLREIDELEAATGRKGSLVDELADRRKGGKPDAEGVAPARRRSKNVGA